MPRPIRSVTTLCFGGPTCARCTPPSAPPVRTGAAPAPGPEADFQDPCAAEPGHPRTPETSMPSTVTRPPRRGSRHRPRGTHRAGDRWRRFRPVPPRFGPKAGARVTIADINRMAGAQSRPGRPRQARPAPRSRPSAWTLGSLQPTCADTRRACLACASPDWTSSYSVNNAGIAGLPQAYHRGRLRGRQFGVDFHRSLPGRRSAPSRPLRAAPAGFTAWCACVASHRASPLFRYIHHDDTALRGAAL